MKSGLLLLIIATSAAAIGYLEIRHQAAREDWRAEASRLTGRLERAESLAGERMKALADAERKHRQEAQSAARLADLEAHILDAAAELAILESDRAVARDRADKAIDDLKEQVRAFTAIEMDMATLGQRRQRLERHVDTVENRLQRAETGAAERQKLAEQLDRDIAGLAVRRETLQAKLSAAERTMAETALAAAARASGDGAIPAPATEPTGEPAAIPAIAPASIVENGEIEDRDRTRGLYQFGSLSAEPEDSDAGQGGPPSREEDEGADERSRASDWAEDQYLMGLTLLSTAEQNSGTRELSDAILAFKAVLGEWPRERDPMRWAIARSDLGYALALLGKRQGSAGVLEEAAAASREALDQFKPRETPLLWAAAQHHLGVSLGALADVRDDPNLRQGSIEALEQAIAAFKDAGAETDAQKAEKRLRETVARLPEETTEAPAPVRDAVE